MRTGPYAAFPESGVIFRGPRESGPWSYSVADDEPDADGALSAGHMPSDGGCRGEAQLPALGAGSSNGRAGETGSPDRLVGVCG